jgi:hypothetical protein
MKIVVIMPFHNDFDPVFETIKEVIKKAVPQARYVRLDLDLSAGDVLAKFRHHVKEAAICIADVTTLNPNVMWEVGYASALNKPIVAISQSTENLPFDIHHFTVHSYHLEDQAALGEQLARALSETQRQVAADIDQHVIAVDGSHTVDRYQARKAFERIAAPYLGGGFTWYCGARDPMQQEIVGFLMDHGERITVMNRNDRHIDIKLFERLKRHEARILDPQDELATRGRASEPVLIQGFDAKFTLYARRAECVFLLWDGKSAMTGQFQQWLAANGKTFLLVRV